MSVSFFHAISVYFSFFVHGEICLQCGFHETTPYIAQHIIVNVAGLSHMPYSLKRSLYFKLLQSDPRILLRVSAFYLKRNMHTIVSIVQRIKHCGNYSVPLILIASSMLNVLGKERGNYTCTMYFSLF